MMNEYVFLGIMWGVAMTLAIQWYGRRKVRQAIGAPDAVARKQIAQLDAENGRQVGQIDRLQERIAVLERITTDTGYQTARAIDALSTR